MSKVPKIAILGIHLESNKFAPPVGRVDFAEKFLAYGDDLLIDSRSEYPMACATLSGFVREMDKIGPWIPAPLVYADEGAAGPIDHAFFLELMDEMLAFTTICFTSLSDPDTIAPAANA